MFEPTAGRLQLDINSLLVNIYRHTDSYVVWERGNIHCVRPLGRRMHTIIVVYTNMLKLHLCGRSYGHHNLVSRVRSIMQ